MRNNSLLFACLYGDENVLKLSVATVPQLYRYIKSNDSHT